MTQTTTSEKTTTTSKTTSEKPSSSSSTSSSTSIFVPPTIEDCNGTELIKEYQKQGFDYFIKDPNFKDGFKITKSTYKGGESPYHDSYKGLYQDFTRTYGFTIPQWNTRYDIYNSCTHNKSNYGLSHELISEGKNTSNGFLPGKVIRFNSLTGNVYLESNCEVEYEQPRKGNEPWVHLLLEQDFGKQEKLRVSTAVSLILDMSYVVTKCERKMSDSEYDPSIHTAQFVWYVTLQNRNVKSSDYGKYVWFGFSLFDYRNQGTKTTTVYTQHDEGTSALIYCPPSTSYHIKTNGCFPSVNEKARCKLDILPSCFDAYNKATELGYFSNTTWNDLYICGFNFGYEVPGTFNISAEIESFNIFAK